MSGRLLPDEMHNDLYETMGSEGSVYVLHRLAESTRSAALVLVEVGVLARPFLSLAFRVLLFACAVSFLGERGYL